MSTFKWSNAPIEVFMSICQNTHGTANELVELLDYLHVRISDTYFNKGFVYACRDANMVVIKYLTRYLDGFKLFDQTFIDVVCPSGHCNVAEYFLNNQLCNENLAIFNQALEQTCIRFKLSEPISMIKWLLKRGANNYEVLQHDGRIQIQRLWYDGYIPLNAIKDIRPDAISVHQQIQCATFLVLNIVDLDDIVLQYLFK
jgi:hypothetical protein